MSRPQFITFIGVDDSTPLVELQKISRDYPGKAKWGVLYDNASRAQANTLHNKYASEVTKRALERIARQYYFFHIVAVLSGRQAERALYSNYFPKSPWHAIQLDISGVSSSSTRHMRSPNAMGFRQEDMHVILKTSNPNRIPVEYRRLNWLYEEYGQPQCFDRVISHFPTPYDDTDALIGYTGNISSNNISDIMDKIDTPNYWLNMEDSLRDNNNDFDYVQCRRILRKIYNF